MGYRLGLDVGTASCGLVTWQLDKQRQPTTLRHVSLDIWQEPVDKSDGVGKPKAKKAARRTARLARRGHCRRARKLRRIAHLASKLGLTDAATGFQGGQTIHALRAQAAEARIELRELLAVLLHLAKNRGPSGDWVYAKPEEPKGGKPARGRKAAKPLKVEADIPDGAFADSEQTEAERNVVKERKGVVGGVQKLSELMDEAAQSLGRKELTLGQYLHYRRSNGECVVIGKPSVGLYPSRRLVEREFAVIWETQAKGEDRSFMWDANLREKFFNAIFFQRPLKSPAPMVGRCPLEPTLPRAPAAQAVAQAFRIEKQLADLRWGLGKRSQPLSKEQNQVIRTLLHAQCEVSFSTILHALGEAGCPAPQGLGLNMDRSSRESLKGNSTLAALRKLKLNTEWAALDTKTQVQVINFLADLGSPDALDSDRWHENFQTGQKDPATGRPKLRQFSAPFVEFINLMRKPPRKLARLTAMGFDGKRMGYSIKALEKLTALMKEGWDEHYAIAQAYPDSLKPKPVMRELPLPEETGNVVVDVAMRQVYRAVRRAMEAMGGPPAQVIVELSRDMALGLTKRGEIETKINVNNKARRDAAKVLEAHGEIVSNKKIDRYLLWESQLHYCPYCADRIELSEALGSETEREHILPRSLTRVGGKRSQIVLAHRHCNQQKGNRTPRQAFGSDAARWRIVEERAAQLAKNKQWGKAKLLLLDDWQDEVLDNAAIKDFSERQFHEGSWIAKLTAEWLRSVCQKTPEDEAPVLVSRGALTAHLRRIWKLDTVIPEVRYASALPVLDREGVQITLDDFQKHKLWWEGHDEKHGGAVPTERKPDKRIDHRHHLVDALVISLTDRRLFKLMADHYRIESDKARRGERARLSRFVEPPWGLREIALEVVTNTLPRHKPDRHPDGNLFKGTAYGLSRRADEKGDFKLASSSLLKDLIDVKSNSIKTTRKRLESIESEITKKLVLEAFDQRIAEGIKLKQVFDAPILNSEFKTPIRRVRLLGNSVETAAEVKHKNQSGTILHKRYAHEGYSYLDVLVDEGKIVGEPRPVRPIDALAEKGTRAPHGVKRFWKGDTVQLSDGSFYTVAQIKKEGGGRLFLVPVTETCGFDELAKRGLSMKTVMGKSLASIRVINV